MRLYLASLLLSLSALPGHADPAVDAARAYATDKVKPWLATPALVTAILDQNARTSALSSGEIDSMDKEWRESVGQIDNPVINGVLHSSAADLLNRQVTEAAGMITEIIVMDAVGLNVAASAVTSDYWQGDEPKFTETFPKGADALHISEVEFDESAQSYQIQVSMPVVNPADGAVIGAITVALDAEQL